MRHPLVASSRRGDARMRGRRDRRCRDFHPRAAARCRPCAAVQSIAVTAAVVPPDENDTSGEPAPTDAAWALLRAAASDMELDEASAAGLNVVQERWTGPLLDLTPAERDALRAVAPGRAEDEREKDAVKLLTIGVGSGDGRVRGRTRVRRTTPATAGVSGLAARCHGTGNLCRRNSAPVRRVRAGAGAGCACSSPTTNTSDFVSRLKTLQETRRRHQQARNSDRPGLAPRGQPRPAAGTDDGVIRERLSGAESGGRARRGRASEGARRRRRNPHRPAAGTLQAVRRSDGTPQARSARCARGRTSATPLAAAVAPTTHVEGRRLTLR